MLNRLPRGTQLPPLSCMLDDIGNPRPRDLARALGVTERAVRRWQDQDQAPMPVMLAIFWLTRWGHSAVDCDAHNAAVLHAVAAEGMRREVAALTEKLARLGQIADFGAANDPAQGVALPMPQPALDDRPRQTGPAAQRTPITKKAPATKVSRARVCMGRHSETT